jgi:predicted neutral ceramidase superfamily lipid hydrolase
MSKEQFKGLFSLWVFVIIIELVWLFMVTINIYDSGFLAFIITLIVSTLAVGAVGIYLVSKNITD